MHSEVKRREYFAVNGNAFTSLGNNIIRIDVSGEDFLDPKNSYLRYRFTNLTAGAGVSCGIDYGGGHTFIRRMRIEQAGNVLSDVNNYNKLMSSVILPSQGTRDSLQHRSLTENCRWANETAAGNSFIQGGLAAAATVTGGSVTTPTNSQTLVAQNGTMDFCIPLVNGLLGTTQEKLVPLALLGSSPLTIELELCPLLDIGVFSGAPAVGSDYQIDNVRYVASLVETPPVVHQQIKMVQEMSGGRLMLNGTDFTHFNGAIAQAATGQQNINVPARRRSINSVFFVGASQNFAGAGILQAVAYNMSFGGNFNMTEYNLKIGSLQVPPQPIQCNYGAVGWAGESRSEHLSELEKCVGTLGSTTGAGSLCSHNFATGDCDVANMGQATVGAAGDATYQFSPFAIDMRSFARVATSSGANTADRSTPITLQINIGAAAGEAINVDAFVAYDSLYYIDQSGTIRVSL
jgi:hypothetical protein